MNLEHFANQLLEQCEELRAARSRIMWLEDELMKYDIHMRDSNASYEKLWCGLITKALDPTSEMNKNLRSKQND